MPEPRRVIDDGPIGYREIAIHGDADLEHGLRHAGYEPERTTYRVVEIDVGLIDTAASFATWNHKPESLVAALRQGAALPPVVVIDGVHRFVLIDGVHRTYAHWALGKPTIQAYELLT